MSRSSLVDALQQAQAAARQAAVPGQGESELIHSLQVHQIELEMQNRELREAQGALEASRSAYVDLFDLAPVGYFIFDAAGVTRSVNLTAAAMFGMDRRHLVGRPLAAIAALDDRRGFREHLRRCVLLHRRETMELTISRKDQPPIVVQAESTPLVDAGGTGGRCRTVFTDISALKRAQDILSFLSNAGEALAGSLDYATTLGTVSRLAVPTVADVAFVEIVEPDGRIRRLQVAFASPEKERLADRVMAAASRLDEKTAQGRVLRSGDPILIPEATDDMTGEAERVCGATSLLYVPMNARGVTLGVLTLLMAESGRRFGPEDLAIARDLARRAATAFDNSRLYGAAQRAIRAREDVLGVVSHDLRNILGSLLLQAETILKVSPAEWTGIRRVETLRDGVLRMSRITDDLLDLASIDAGQLAVESEPNDVAEILTGAVALLEPEARKNELALVVRVPETAKVLCDRARVLQILSNLAGNAIKFTPKGGSVTLEAQVEADAVRISVRDTGPGIPPDVRKHLFERYRQARATAAKGHGLGLFISRGLVERQGGAMSVESEVGQGTTFSFTLPRTGDRDLSH